MTGVLDARHDALDLLAASFPGGSITGAPKIRAMQIIEELDQQKLITPRAGGPQEPGCRLQSASKEPPLP